MGIWRAQKCFLLCTLICMLCMAFFILFFYQSQLVTIHRFSEKMIENYHAGLSMVKTGGAVPKTESVPAKSSHNTPKAETGVAKQENAVKKNEPTNVVKTTPGKKVTQKSHDSNSWNSSQSVIKVELFPNWTTSDPHDKSLIRRVYLYSAIVALHNTPPSGTDVHFVTYLEGRQPTSLTCCAKLSNGTILADGKADVAFSYTKWQKGEKPNPKDFTVYGMVLKCRFRLQAQELVAGHATLATATCPTESSQYVTVVHPEKKPGGLAVCAKIAYGHNLNPRKLVEWFEMQRLLGVDRVQLFDLNNTDAVLKILRHYQDSGFLNLLSYKLPGRPWDRTIFRGTKQSTTWGDEKELPIWDCRLRLAGYDYVMGIDLDEVILPRNYVSLKSFIKDQFKKHPDAGGLFFNVQFFIEDWGPLDRSAPLMFLQYLNSTAPRWECYKYIYLPAKINQAATHRLFYVNGAKQYTVPSAEATIFHYRKCPHVWKSCNPTAITDRSILRFKDHLLPAVTSVNKTLGF